MAQKACQTNDRLTIKRMVLPIREKASEYYQMFLSALSIIFVNFAQTFHTYNRRNNK